MTNKDLHLQVIACSLFEGVTEFKNVYSAYKMVAKSNKAGIVSTSLLCKEIGKKVAGVRLAYKGKGGIKLTQYMIDKLNEIGFTWGRTKKYEDNLSV